VFAAVRKQADADSLRAEAASGLETVMLDLVDHASIAAAAKDVGAGLSGS
jgi:hypothetical protein